MMSKAQRKQIFSAFSCNKRRGPAGVVCCERRDAEHAVARVGHSWCSRVQCWFVLFLRSEIKKFLVKTAKVFWQNRKQIQEITSGVQFQRIKTF